LYVPPVGPIDQDIASSAEIFAGAIRDHRRGTIVGVRSFGKGSVQGIFPLDDSPSGIRLTTAKFYSLNGKPFVHVGVDPDIPVQPARMAAKPVDGHLAEAEEVMLRTATRTARALSQTLQARNSQ
jgi:carboxyl-terminal processing protease